MKSSATQVGNTLNKWDCHFFRKAQEAATMSKDPSTQVGCVIVDDMHRTMGEGYNGFPRGVGDQPDRYLDKTIKYEMVVHAEINAILNSIVEPRGGIMYCLAFPCARCAAVIIQAGIKKVYAAHAPDYEARWEAQIKVAKTMFTEAGVEVVHLTSLDRPFTHPSHYKEVEPTPIMRMPGVIVARLFEVKQYLTKSRNHTCVVMGFEALDRSQAWFYMPWESHDGNTMAHDMTVFRLIKMFPQQRAAWWNHTTQTLIQTLQGYIDQEFDLTLKPQMYGKLTAIRIWDAIRKDEQHVE